MNVITHTLTLVETEGGEPLRSPGSFEGSLRLVRDADAAGFGTEVQGPVGSGTAFGAGFSGAGLGDVDEEQEWQERALCAQTDPEAFFPEKGGSTREAKRICSGCEVKAECLDYALAHDERFGIWGGLSERERRRLRRLA